MHSEQEAQKKMAEALFQGNLQSQCGAGLAGSAGMNCEPARPGLRERVESDLHRASREVRKLELLHELSFLLQKNPEVARILDLVEMVRG